MLQSFCQREKKKVAEFLIGSHRQGGSRRQSGIHQLIPMFFAYRNHICRRAVRDLPIADLRDVHFAAPCCPSVTQSIVSTKLLPTDALGRAIHSSAPTCEGKARARSIRHRSECPAPSQCRGPVRRLAPTKRAGFQRDRKPAMTPEKVAVLRERAAGGTKRLPRP